MLVSCLVVLPLISMAQMLSKPHVQMKYYLFTCFTNNTTAGQQICYADGVYHFCNTSDL